MTGHLGYIGSVMAPYLLEQGHEVSGLDSNLYDGCVFGEAPPFIPTIRKDIRDVAENDLKGYDSVIHLAGLSNDPLGDFDKKLTYSINYEASVSLATAAKKAGVKRFLFSSSCSVYGEASRKMLTETSETNPITPYADSKLLSELEISKLADTTFSPTFLRSATAYGVSYKLRFDLVLNNLVAWAFTSGIVKLKSDGLSWRPLVHVEDISRAYAAVLDAEPELVSNQVFNVGWTKENYQIRELAEIVKNSVPNSNVEFEKGSGPDKRSYRVNFDKIAKKLPKYHPKWTASSGAKQLCDEYGRFDLKGTDFESSKYNRLGRLKELIQSEKLDCAFRWKESI
jgi:nucleoside-diphosphate-sugar epimerase